MRKIFRVLLSIIAILAFIIVAIFAYLNFIYLPQKVKSEGPAFLEEKTKGRLRAESIQYIPFKGVKFKNISLLSRKKEQIFTVEKLYFNVNIWPLLIHRELNFRLDLYPPGIKRPFVFKGLYRIKQKILDLDFQIKNRLFIQSQTLYGKVRAILNSEGKSDIDLNINSPDLNIDGTFFVEDEDLRIKKLSGKILETSFDFIGDVQNLGQPLLNIYGNIELDLGSLKKINPEYIKGLNKLKMDGRCSTRFYIANQINNPEVGLKMNAGQIRIRNIDIRDLSAVSKIKNRKVYLSKLYAKLCGGEINLEGKSRLDLEGFPTAFNLNIFNLNLNEIIKGITDRDLPVHGRLFSLARLSGYLRQPRTVEGKLWLSVSGSNIFELPVFEGLANILRLPELRKVEFKEAGGNFTIAEEEIRTDDFKIASNNIAVYFKGYMDFRGDLGFDIQPHFSQSFLSTVPNISNILGIFIDSAGNFLGEIKMKGNIKNPRYTFKPISVEKLLPKGLEEGLKQLFKLKKERK